MKICFLTDRMLLGYGVDLVVDRLAHGLSENGFDVTVCCSIRDRTFRGQNYSLHCLPYKHNVFSPKHTERNAFRTFRAFLKDQDLLIACTFPFYYVASASRKPWIALDFGIVPSAFYRWRVKWELQYHQRTNYEDYFPQANQIICISNFLQKNLPSEIRNRAKVVHLGVDHYPRKYLCNIKTLYGVEGLLLLYVGRSSDTSPYKNVESLLSIRKKIPAKPKIDLIISTSCSLEEQGRLERWGAIVVNALTMEFMPSLYKSSDVYVTATRWEGFNLPLLEASYFGLPVVAFRIGAHPEIVQHGRTGYLASNEGEFTDYLLKLVQDKELRSKIGLNGMQFAEANFTWRKTVNQYTTILQEMI